MQHAKVQQELLMAYDLFIPDCDRKGNYKPVQCHTLSRICWCVDAVVRLSNIALKRTATFQTGNMIAGTGFLSWTGNTKPSCNTM